MDAMFCPVCGCPFGTDEALDNHFEAVHETVEVVSE